MDRKTALKRLQSDLLKGISEDNALYPHIVELVGHFKGPLAFIKGQSLILKKDRHRNVFFILKGAVVEYGRTELGGPMVPNGYTSEQWCMNLSVHSEKKTADFSYKCLSETLVMKLDETYWDALLHQPIYDEIQFIINQRFLSQERDHYYRLVHLTPLEHLQWVKEKNPTLFEALTKDELAAILGISRATLFRMQKRR